MTSNLWGKTEFLNSSEKRTKFWTSGVFNIFGKLFTLDASLVIAGHPVHLRISRKISFQIATSIFVIFF